MTDFLTPWLDPLISQQQRAAVDKWISLPESEWPIHFRAFAEAVRATGCPGMVAEWGCGVGHGKEILDRAGVTHADYVGFDANPASIALAKERYPDAHWSVPQPEAEWNIRGQADVVVDGSLLLHVEAWREHIEELCASSRRWLILHRLPATAAETHRTQTNGYGHTFPAWEFSLSEVTKEAWRHGFEVVEQWQADGHSSTILFAKPRIFVSYCDGAYLPKLRALHASLVRHAGPFRLHVLAWDTRVRGWAEATEGVEATFVEDWLNTHPELRHENLPGPPRSGPEHMWTVGPAFLRSIMEETGEPVTYLDADLFCFSSPEPMFAAIGDAPAAFVGHNFARAHKVKSHVPSLETHRAFGLWNVGAVHVSDIAIARRWADLVRAHCIDKPMEVEITVGPVPIQDRRLRYADQTYLEDIAREFTGCVLFTEGDPDYLAFVARHFPGARVVRTSAVQWGPWGAHAFELTERYGVPHFDGKPIVFAHMSSLKFLPHGGLQYTRPEYGIGEREIEVLYRPYLEALREGLR